MHLLARFSFFILTVLLAGPAIGGPAQGSGRPWASTGGKRQQLNGPAAVRNGL